METLRFLAWLFLSPKGRIRRGQWWLGTSIGLAISLPLPVYASYNDLEAEYFTLIALLDLAMLYPFYAVDAKRFHDRDRSSLWALFATVTGLLITGADWLSLDAPHEMEQISDVLIGVALTILIWFIIDLGCARGTPGRNLHGDDPMLKERLFSITSP